jgi:hypothetical protein
MLLGHLSVVAAAGIGLGRIEQRAETECDREDHRQACGEQGDAGAGPHARLAWSLGLLMIRGSSSG